MNIEADDMDVADVAAGTTFGVVSFKSDFKKRLVDESHKVDSCYAFVTDKYNVKHYTLRKYYKRVSRGLPTFETGGRPKKLDQESVESIKRYMANQEWTKMSVHAEIRKEISLTARRRYPKGIPEGVKVNISKSSVRMWAATFISSNANRDGDVDLEFGYDDAF